MWFRCLYAGFRLVRVGVVRGGGRIRVGVVNHLSAVTTTSLGGTVRPFLGTKRVRVRVSYGRVGCVTSSKLHAVRALRGRLKGTKKDLLVTKLRPAIVRMLRVAKFSAFLGVGWSSCRGRHSVFRGDVTYDACVRICPILRRW